MTSTTTRPTVAVIVCAYTLDRLDDLIDCIDSLHGQSTAPDELVCVVDHNDVLATRLRRLASERAWSLDVIASEEPRGLSGARNTGVAATTSELALFIDDDAVADPDWLEELVAPFADPTYLRRRRPNRPGLARRSPDVVSPTPRLDRRLLDPDPAGRWRTDPQHVRGERRVSTVGARRGRRIPDRTRTGRCKRRGMRGDRDLHPHPPTNPLGPGAVRAAVAGHPPRHTPAGNGHLRASPVHGRRTIQGNSQPTRRHRRGDQRRTRIRPRDRTSSRLRPARRTLRTPVTARHAAVLVAGLSSAPRRATRAERVRRR